MPKPDQEMILRTDASNNSISAILQTNNREPISFYSRVLTDVEKKYDVVEKEALAIFWGIKKCRTFLIGKQFTVQSDHKPLQYLFSAEKVSPKILRWRLQLQEYTFKV